MEIWPTGVVVPPGYRIALTVRGKDYEYEGEAATLSNMKNPMKGSGPFIHDDETDRPAAVFGGRVTLHVGPGRKSSGAVAGDPAEGVKGGRTRVRCAGKDRRLRFH